jgi:pre-mRNA-processing factor 19
MLQSEYDVVLLELHDTRVSLEETRRELSSALYQNDAAVRVVARLAQERDEARGKLEGYLMTDTNNNNSNTNDNGAVVEEQRNQSSSSTNKRTREEIKEGGYPSPYDATTTKKLCKRATTTSGSENVTNDVGGGRNITTTTIPDKDKEAMNETWNTLTTNRRTKFKLKRTPDQIANNELLLVNLATKYNNKDGHESKKVNIGKSSAKAGILCLSTVTYDFGPNDDGVIEYLLTSTHDKTAIVYNVQSGSIFTTLSGGGASGVVTTVHAIIHPYDAIIHAYDEGERMWVVTGSTDGYVRLYCVLFGADAGSSRLIGCVKLNNNETLKEEGHDDAVVPVNVTIHPSSTDHVVRILVASSVGAVELYKFEGNVRNEDTEEWVIDKPSELVLLSRLSSHEVEDDTAAHKYTAGCMHPDGLIYIAGMSDGRLIVWDMKTQTVAGMLVTEGGGGDDSTSSYITNIAISENGYHVASSTVGSDGTSTIKIWDLRKLKMIASIKPSIDEVGQIISLAFDPTASYLAYTGEVCTKVCVVKDWDRVICTLSPSKTSGGSKKKGGSSSSNSGGGIVWGGKGFGPLEDGGQGKVWLATGCDGERPVRFWGVE